ncbi:hypothetical protein ACROYT_G014010 [Oculina patagonica]
MAVPTVTSTKETTNYARLCRLLIDVGSEALRNRFDGILPPANLPSVLASSPALTTLQTLEKKKVLNPTQWSKLYPSTPSTVSSKQFDITLLMVLLRNICGLSPPVTTGSWDKLPPATDTSVEADIARVKYFRNILYGHTEKASVDDATFRDYWSDIRDVLVRLGGPSYGAAIDKLKTECMDPGVEEHYKELLKLFKKDDDDIKDKIEELKKEFDDKLDEMSKKLSNGLANGKDMTSGRQQSLFDDTFESELPDEPVNVHGHITEVHDIVETLSDDSSKAVAAVLVSGIPGIGKTTVAIQAGHQLKTRRGCLVKFCSLRFADADEKKCELTVNKGERELREILNVCVPGHQQTNEFPRFVLLNWCRRLEHELILVLDNAEDAMEDDVGSFFIELLKEMRKCSRSKLKFLITSRRSKIDPATGLNVKTIKLGPLDLEESNEVLKNGAKLQSESEDQNVKLQEIAELCERIPLALQLAGPLLSTESEYTVDELIKELQNDPTKTLRCERMMRMMEIAFEKLNEALQHALVCLSVFVRSFDRNAAKALLGLNYAEYLTKLIERCLIQKQDDRYLIHLFIRSYARRVGRAKFPQILAHGHQSFLEYFLSLILKHAKTYWGKDTCKDAFDLFNAERLNYESTLRDVGDKKIRNCRELEGVVTECLLVALYIGDCVHIKLYDDFLKALLYFVQSQERVIQKVEILCLIYHEGRKRGCAKKQFQDEAIKLHDENVHLFEQNGLSEVFYLCYYGKYLSHCNRKEESQLVFKKALSIYEEQNIEATFIKARILRRMGYILKEVGSTEEACKNILEALQLLQVRYGNHVLTAFTQKEVGDYYLDVEEFPKAEENYQKAISIFEVLKITDHKEAVSTFKNLGLCFEKSGMFDESRKTYEKAIDIADNTIEGNHKWKVEIKTFLALLLSTNYQEELDTANRIAKEALQMGKELGLQDWRRKKELEVMYERH